MEASEFVAILLVLAAIFSYLNYRVLRWPSTVGVMAMALLASLVAVAIGRTAPAVERPAVDFVRHIDFSRAVLHGMLGFLLFAGALRVDVGDLGQHKVAIAVLSTFGVLLSTVIVGVLMWCVLTLLRLPARPIYCLLFGALISPTDPIAVLALFKRIGVPRSLDVIVAGESLFNDGVGVALFVSLLQIAVGGGVLDVGRIATLFLREAAGGAAFGLAAGYLVYRLIKTIDNYQVEILLSIALVAGGYALAQRLNVSGPIAMVVAGLLLGNPGRLFAMSPQTVRNLSLFWDVIDQVLNAVLFVLLGLEVLAITFTRRHFEAGLLAIPVVLLARLVSTGVPMALLRCWQPADSHAVRILTWGGLRGALAVAMALSIPTDRGGVEAPERIVILVMTYVVVVFSILVQGLTIGPLARRWLRLQSATGR